MTQSPVTITTPDGTADAVLFHDARPRPGVIHLTDIGGIRPATLAMAERVALAGYTVLVPNVFYRTARPPVLDMALFGNREKLMERVAELGGPLTPEAVQHDANAYVEFMAAQPSVSPGAMAVAGHCFTGAVAMRIAAARPDRIAAVASFHGGGLFSEKPTSPHLLLPRIKARLYFAHASDDRSMPAEAIANLEQTLAAWGGRYESETYPDAYHSWTVSDSQVYNEAAANRAHERLIELLKQTIG
jgi:carboxymethylenebutenolidase